jgi:hypothetical protein
MPRRGQYFNIEWDGMDEFIRLLEEMPADFERILIEEYTEYGMLMEEGTKALAPHDEGNLEDNINFDKAKRVGTGVVLEGGVSNVVYARRRHEEPYRSGKHPKYDDGAKYPNYYINGRGARTRSKPKWRGKMPGRKYLANAVIATKEDYEEMNKRVLDRTLRGRS